MRGKDIVMLTASVVLAAALLWQLADRGGPYFNHPVTIVEHVARQKHDTRDALLLLPRVRPLLPRNATVTCFHPRDGKWQYDAASFHAAIGQLPQQFVLPPFSAAENIPKETMVRYVVALETPFTNPSYRLVKEFPDGRLYEVVR